MNKKAKRIVKILVVVFVCLFAAHQKWPQKTVQWVNSFVRETESEILAYHDIFTQLAPHREPSSQTDAAVSSSDEQKKGEGSVPSNLEVHFIDVGNADSILILCDDEAALIDAGENDCGDLVVDYLQDQGVNKLKYAVGTHPHSDHIGGMDTVLLNIPTETVLLPAKDHTTKTYKDVLTAIQDTDANLYVPKVGDELRLAEATITVLSPDRVWDDLNNNSIVLLLENGEDSFIFAGDAETDAEAVMLDAGIVPEADVLKVGHHGSNTSTSYRWLWTIMPDYCVIPCGTDNSYGHPHEEVLSRLSDHSKVNGTTIYRSDENGNIVAYSDGHGNIRFETERNKGWQYNGNSIFKE